MLSAAHGNCPASLAGCSLAYQTRLLHAEPAAYLLRTVLSMYPNGSTNVSHRETYTTPRHLPSASTPD
jgi:hypothetical protein